MADIGLAARLLAIRIRKLAWVLPRPTAWAHLRRGVVPSVEHIGLIRRLAPSFVIDAGANKGQFSLAVRSVSPSTEIIAFEPLVDAGAVLQTGFHGDPKFSVRTVALGASHDRVGLYVTASDDSSSLLPVGPQQVKLFPSSRVIGHQEVTVESLDSQMENVELPSDTLLKIDVQGGEFALLRGASETLKRISHVYVELSFVALYDGQSLASEVIGLLATEGFQLCDVANVSRTRGGEAVQADFLFERAPIGSAR